MKMLGYWFGAVPAAALVVCCWGNFARAEIQTTQAVVPSWSAGPGAQGLALLPRGGGGDELWAGDPTCIPLANSAQVGAQGGFMQECGDGQWVSLAYPVLTSGETIESLNIIHNTNTGEGDLYLLGDCGGNPDTNNILWAGCACIEGTVGGAVTNYCIGEPLVDSPAKIWVVAVFRDDFSFDIAFDDGNHGPGHTFGSLLDTGNCGDWDDLNDFGFGGCSWVSLVVAGSPGVPECCDSPALCDGDVNGDGLVDPLDSGFILARFGLDASDPANCQADANCDGLIDPLDSGYVLARFGVCNEPIECPIGGGVPGECDGGGGGCGDPSCPPPTSDCCEVHTDPGCDAVCGSPDDGGVEECVCTVDDFCCNVTWDSACVEIVELFGCADCSENNPDCAECASNEDCPLLGYECIDGSCTCVESPPANDDCGDAVATTIGTGDSSSFDGNTTCATNDCTALAPTADQWYEVTTTATGTFTVALCGTPSVFGNAFIVLDQSCPCSGVFTNATDFNQTDCADGNWTLIWSALPADTYFYPVLSELGSEGDFTVTFSLD
ncbi:MAG: hypothetical protein IID37_10000 [Planctomycetes bacterium]|nr:hypothetical protein [Planctomycetota bacterium]